MQFQSFCFFWFTFLFELRHEMVCKPTDPGLQGTLAQYHHHLSHVFSILVQLFIRICIWKETLKSQMFLSSLSLAI